MFFTYTFLEYMNIFNILFQIKINDLLLGGKFKNYGFTLIKFYLSDRSHPLVELLNPLNQIFPKIAKCQYNDFAPSGEVVVSIPS